MLSKSDFLYDKRLVDRFIKRGDLSRADYRAHLQALPDVADKGEPLVSGERAPHREDGERSDDE